MVREESYILATGDVIEVERMPPKSAAFLRRIVSAAHDPNVSVVEFVALLFGAENPALRPGSVTGFGFVTPSSFGDPLFQIGVDLLCRKRVQLREAQAEARSFTMTVQEAARSRGVHESAIRQAIQNGRAAAVKRGKAWFLDPQDVAALELKGRLAPDTDAVESAACPALEAQIGSAEGCSFRLKTATFERQTGGDGTVFGVVPSFERAAVICGPKGKYRFFVLESAPGEQDEVRFGDFYVRGHFRVVEKVNNSQVATARWRAFEPR